MNEPNQESSNTVTIALSNQPSVRVDPETWPTIAAVARLVDGNDRMICVREHRTAGRRIVFGKSPDQHAGFIVENNRARGAETVRAIKRVAGLIGAQSLVEETIRALPAEDI